MSSLTRPLERPGNPHHPPGPTSWWSLPLIRRFRHQPLEAMLDFFHLYGDAVRFRFLGQYFGYFFFHPEHVRHILQDNNRNYTKEHPSFLVMRPLVGLGLLTSDGEFWRQQRRLAQPAFHRRRLAEFGQTMTGATERMLGRWEQAARREEMVTVDEEMMALTLSIVGLTLFGVDLAAEAGTIGHAFGEVNEIVSRLSSQPFSPLTVRWPWWPSTRRMNGFIRELDVVVNRIIAERRREPSDRGDLLSMLMLAEDETTGRGMDDRQLRDEVMTLMLAGHETTAIALSWALLLLSRHPEVREALREELARVLAGRTPTVADLPELTYTRMVVDETLRLYPPAYAMGRFGVAADEVGGYDVMPGAVVGLSPYVTHRHPEFWTEPEAFRPERFSPSRVADRHRFAYFPFGAGPRLCIGNNFALMEAQLVLATIMQRVDLALAPGHVVGLNPLITLRPSGGLPMRVQTRV